MDESVVRCSECNAMSAAEDVFAVDGEPVCSRCLYGEAAPVRIFPIGRVVNDQHRNRSDFGRSGGGTSRIELAAGQERFMHGLEDETDLTVVYYLHEARPVRSRFRRGLDRKKVSVFASRTPDRLSRIAIQEARLVGVEGTTLIVEDLDAIDGSPVLDLKLGRRRLEGR